MSIAKRTRWMEGSLMLGLTACLCFAGARAIAEQGAAKAVPPGQVGASVPGEPATPAIASMGTAKPAERLREGTRLIDEVGTFQNVGDRIAFVPGDKDSYRVLENLQLQRIGQSLDGARGQQLWVVSGVITEFCGANYLLVTKASIQSQEGAAAGNR